MSSSAYPRLQEPDNSRLISALITSLLRKAQVGEITRQAYHARLFSYAVRLLGSSLGQDGSPDALGIVQVLKQRLSEQQRSGDALSLQEKYNKLSQSRAISPRTLGALLHVLQQAAQGQLGSPSVTIAAYQPLQVPQQALPIFNGTGAAAAAGAAGARQGTAAAGTAPGAPAHAVPDLLGGPALAPPMPPAARPGPPNRNGPAAAAAAAAVPPPPPPAAAAPGVAPGINVKEPALVKDVLRVAQALPGTYCRLVGVEDPAGAFLEVAGWDETGLSPSDRQVLHLLAELGVMYSTVAHQVEESQDKGAVRQALGASLQQELTDLYRLMAVLEAQQAYSLPMPGDSPESAASPYLSLRRLLLWLADPLRRLRLMACLADGTAGQGGGVLAGSVWAHTKCGDPAARAYFTQVLNQVCLPFFDMIRRWVFEGLLEDPHQEFFITRTALVEVSSSSGAKVAEAPDPWTDLYRIEPAKVPPFISPELAQRILRAGKSINFLRDSCGDVAWVHDWAAASQDAAAAVGFGQLSSLEALVARAAAEVDGRVMEQLWGRHHLAAHCDAVRRYLLLGQGDWVLALLDAAAGELSKPAREVSDAALTHLLHAAVLGSAARADEEDVISRLTARKQASAGDGETGWDVFKLQYQVKAPLSSFFTGAAMDSYSRVSRLVWQLRRAERTLCIAWRTLKVEIGRDLPRFRSATRGKLEGLLRSFLQVRARMAHFATNLQYYITFEVLEGAWEAFQARAATAGDLDTLLSAHSAYLATLLRQCLLGEDAQGLRDVLRALLDTLLGLGPLVARFREQVATAVLHMERIDAAAAANTAGGGWGIPGRGGEGVREELELSEEAVSQLTDQLLALEEQHKTLLQHFTALLPAQVHHDVRFLLTRLDFGNQQAAA